MLILNATINFIIGYQITVNMLLNGEIADTLMYARDEEGEILNHLITKTNCWGFATANMFVSMGIFIIISCLIKRGSSNCRYSPL